MYHERCIVRRFFPTLTTLILLGHVPMVLVGHKSDLASRQVSHEEALNFAEQWDIKYFEASSKSNSNVEEALHCLCEQLMDRHREGNPGATRPSPKRVRSKGCGPGCTIL